MIIIVKDGFELSVPWVLPNIFHHRSSMTSVNIGGSAHLVIFAETQGERLVI
jgi:hypothetical protein